MLEVHHIVPRRLNGSNSIGNLITLCEKCHDKTEKLNLTIGSETANERIDWGIEKSHSNDAIVITELKPDTCNVREWSIKPMRRQSKAKHSEVKGFRHRDLVNYVKKSGEKYIGWITAMYPERKQVNIITLDGKVLKRYGIKSLNLLWRFDKIQWM